MKKKDGYLRTGSCFGSNALAVCWILPILFCRTQTRWFVDMISFSSSSNKEQACLARSESCRKVRERATLLIEHKSSNSKPSSLGIGYLHSSGGSTVRLANGILSVGKKYDIRFKKEKEKEKGTKSKRKVQKVLRFLFNHEFPNSPCKPPSFLWQGSHAERVTQLPHRDLCCSSYHQMPCRGIFSQRLKLRWNGVLKRGNRKTRNGYEHARIWNATSVNFVDWLSQCITQGYVSKGSGSLDFIQNINSEVSNIWLVTNTPLFIWNII